MRRCLSLTTGLVAVALLIGAGSSDAKTSWPSRSHPLSATLGWFHAIDARTEQRVDSYMTAHGRSLWSGWPPREWSRFTHLQCRNLKDATPTRASVYCSFHESASPSEGNPDSFWVVELERSSGGWLVSDWGQG